MYLLINMAIAANVSYKIFSKLCKYKDLEMQFLKLGFVKTSTNSVAFGTFSLNVKDSDRQIEGNPVKKYNNLNSHL